MYIVALAWIYVVSMVSIMQPTVLKGVVTFVGTGLLPLALFLYLMGTPQRRRNLRRAQEADNTAGAVVTAEPTRDALDSAPNSAPDSAPDSAPENAPENAPDDVPGDARADAGQSDSRQTSVAQRPVTPSRRNE